MSMEKTCKFRSLMICLVCLNSSNRRPIPHRGEECFQICAESCALVFCCNHEHRSPCVCDCALRKRMICHWKVTIILLDKTLKQVFREWVRTWVCIVGRWEHLCHLHIVQSPHFYKYSFRYNVLFPKRQNDCLVCRLFSSPPWDFEIVHMQSFFCTRGSSENDRLSTNPPLWRLVQTYPWFLIRLLLCYYTY